jgi:PBP1b-binding outer membrane lipoprotein LpoB
MCAEMNDGHMFVELSEPKEKSNEATASLMLTEAEGKIDKKKLSDVELGDRVDSIKHQDIMKYLLSKEKISLGIATMEKIKSVSMALNGPRNTSVPISISGENGRRNFLVKEKW